MTLFSLFKTPPEPPKLLEQIKSAEELLISYTERSLMGRYRHVIPSSVLAKAHGLIFIQQERGMIMARLNDGNWSAPCAVSIAFPTFRGLSNDKFVKSLIVINCREVLEVFFEARGYLQLGGHVSISSGPLGSGSNTIAGTMTAAYTYSWANGTYMAFSFEGTRITTSEQANAMVYGRGITAIEILHGLVRVPKQANMLCNILRTHRVSNRQPGTRFGPLVSHVEGSMRSYPATTATARPQSEKHYSPRSLHPQSLRKPDAAPESTRATGAHHRFSVHKPDDAFAGINTLYGPPHAYNMPSPSAQSTPRMHASHSASAANAYYSSKHAAAEDVSMQGVFYVMAIRDFDPNDAPKLSFKAGDCIRVTRRVGPTDDWWHGVLGNRSGMFPSHLTEKIHNAPANHYGHAANSGQQSHASHSSRRSYHHKGRRTR
ncbi:hypothetical protein BC940DRAFT_289823 [Gongronella butleri]|nr:hypothetical protein BC940DRAFT_289823 [Gongronella butleri]